MPKLAIYVPKKEMKTVEKWRKRLNFSKLFMRALKQEIADRSGKSDPLAAAAAYYAESDPALLVRAAGQERAKVQLLECQLSKESVQLLLDLADRQSLSNQQLEAVLQQCGKKEQRMKLLEQHGFANENTAKGQKLYAEGFLQGLQQTWEQITRRMD